MAVVLLYGSSSTNGLGDYEAGGLGARIKTQFNRRHELEGKPQHAVWDRSSTGERISTTVERLRNDTEDIRLKNAPVVAVFSLGVYDSSTRIASGKNQTPVELFEERAQWIGRTSLTANFKTIFIGMTPLSAHSVKLNNRDEFTEKQRDIYERKTRIIADNLDIPFLNFYQFCGGSNARAEGYVSTDNVHPGVKAHRIIHQFVQREIDAHFDLIPAPAPVVINP